MGGIIAIYWEGLLNIPLGWVEVYLGISMDASWKVIAFKTGCTIGILLLCYEVFLRIKDRKRRKRYERELKEADGVTHASLSDTERSEALNDPKTAVARLRKERDFEKLAEVLSALGRHKEAAKAHTKAGARKRAAAEWAKAGYPLKAAKLLEKARDYRSAAQYYLEKKKYLRAAKTFVRGDALPQAAEAYQLGGKPAESADLYDVYFSDTNAPASERATAAEACLRLLEDSRASSKIAKEKLRTISLQAAEVMLASQRPDIAGRLYHQAGEFVQAGEAYLKAGQLETASKCMHQAGETKRASEIGGRYYEARQQWKEAGMAYEGGGNFRKAGDCFWKANDPLQAGKNFERAREYYGAGMAMVHAHQWEKAVEFLQQLSEDHPHFNTSRGLLGRAFYELKDFAHSAATLENHLLGERVRKDNIDYFWMLALAYEQLGKLDKSQDTLLKIRTVDVSYRDVAQRLSSVQSRISIAGGSGGMANSATIVTPPSGNQKSPVMSMVEQTLQNRYELESELGRGGMGVVYKARDTQLDRPVALKFLGTLVDGSEEFRQRFKREAQAAAQVSHPNILSVYDIGVEQGSSYIAMEYIEGPNLNQYVKKKGALPPREAVNLVGQACAALEAIHQAGIVHRDIKPDNVLIAKGNLVKLMDFGLAKGHGANLTGTNVVMGTPCYMAPEQARGEEATPRSDVYAMGLVLHELLTGKVVFETGNVMERQLTEVPKPPGLLVAGIPDELDAVVMKAIAKKPEERFGSAQEFLNALRAVQT